MAIDTDKQARSTETTGNGVIGRKRLVWIIAGISTVTVIAAIVIPTTIVLTRKSSRLTTTSTTMAATMDIETTRKASCTRNYSVIYESPNNSLIWNIAVADVNEDERLDLIGAFISKGPVDEQVASNTVHVLFQNADQTFTAEKISDSEDLHPISVAATDVNGDEKNDIIVLNADSEILTLYNSENGTFHMIERNFFHGIGSFQMTLADLDNDDILDVIIANSLSNDITILFNTGYVAFDEQMNFNADCQSYYVTTADLKNRGKTDIIVGCADQPKILIFYDNRNGRSFTRAIIDIDYVGVGGVLAVDVNDDAKWDLIIKSGFLDSIAVYLNKDAGEFAQPTIYQTISRVYSLGTGDVNGDKKIDIVVTNENAIDIFFNTGNGTFTTPLTNPTNSMPGVIVINDMNAGDQADIILGNLNSIGILYTYCD